MGGGGSRDCPTHKAQQRRKTQDNKLKFTKSLLAAQLQNNIQDVHPYTCCLPCSDGRLPQGKHCQDKQDSTKPDVPTAAQEVHKHEANQQQQHMQVKLQGNTSMPSGHIPVYCLCILPRNAHQFPALSHSPPSNSVTRPPFFPLLLAE